MIPLTITPEDVKRSKIVAPDWYLCEVKDVTRGPSKDKTSMVIIIDLVGLEGDAAGVPFRYWISEKAPGLAQGYIKAFGVDIDENKGATVDIAATKGKKVGVFIKNETYENRLRNTVDSFRPAA